MPVPFMFLKHPPHLSLVPEQELNTLTSTKVRFIAGQCVSSCGVLVLSLQGSVAALSKQGSVPENISLAEFSSLVFWLYFGPSC